MAGASTYLARALLNHLFRTSGLTKPSTLYLALHAADPTDAGLTASELPIGAGGYARAPLAVGDGSWTPPTTGGTEEVITNVAAITWGTATADLNGGAPIGYFGVWDAPSGGNLWVSGALGVARVILAGDVIQAPIGAITLRVT